MKENTSKVLRRVEQLKSKRRNIEEIWYLIERFITPFRVQLFNSAESDIDWGLRDLYDSTAVNANNNLAAHLHGALTNLATKWYKHVFTDSDMKKSKGAQVWLDEVNSINIRSLQESNFDLEINEFYLDLTSFGTACIMSSEVENPDGSLNRIEYKTIPINECFFDLNVSGELVHFYRELLWSALEIYDKFGESAPEVIKKDIESGNLGNKYRIIFHIYKQQVEDDYSPYKSYAPKNRLYQGQYIFTNTGETIGENIGFHEQPVFISTWRRVPGTVWGYSPSMVAIWDVLTLNQLVKLVLVAGEKVVDPTIMTTKRGVFGDIDLSSGGVIVVQDVEKSIRPFESTARFDVSALQKRELKESIEAIYYVKELQLKESPAMTATEVYARIQLMQRLLGPTFGRLQRNLLDPLVTRHFLINYRYKQFPPLPAEIQERGTALDIQYEGSMIKAQKAEDASAVERWLSITGQIAPIYPEVVDVVEIDEAVRYLGRKGGVPSQLIKAQEQVQSVRQQRAQQQQMMEEIAQKQAAGEAAQQMGKGIQELRNANFKE